MNNETYMIIEEILFDYACGIHTAKKVQSELEKLGYKANLKGDSNIIDVMDTVDDQFCEVVI